MKKLGILVLLAFFLLSQQICLAGDLKIGYVSLTRIFEGYKKVLDSNEEIEKQKDEVKVMLEDMKKLREGFDTLSEEAKQERKNQILAKQENIRKRTFEIRKDEDRVLREILKDIEKTSSEIRKNKKLTYILDDRLIINGPEKMDFTDDVIKLLNKRYKRK